MITIWPDADSYFNLDSLGVRPWKSGAPTGITIHYTADGNMKRVAEHASQHQIGYHFLIDRDGHLMQTASLSRAVNHAGEAKWNGQSPNRSHLAVSIVSWGLLNADGTAWTKKVECPAVSRHGKLWDAATPEQEARLISLCEALCRQFGIAAANICGHDECAIPKGRKVDPGWTLSGGVLYIRKRLAV